MNPISQARAIRHAAMLIVVGLLSGPAGAEKDPFSACDGKGLRSRAHCIQRVATESGLHQAASLRLRRLIAQRPEDPFLLLYAATMDLEGESYDAASTGFRKAATRFAELGEARFEALARIREMACLQALQRPDQAQEAGLWAVEAAERAGDISTALQARLMVLNIDALEGRDLESVRRRLSQLEEDAFLNGYPVQRYWFLAQAGVLADLHRLDEALALNRRWLEAAEQAGHDRDRAAATVNIAFCLSEMSWRSDARQKAIEHARESLDLARATGDPDAELEALRLLGKLLPGPENQEHLRSCIKRSPSPSRARSLCSFALAGALSEDDPEGAWHQLQQALAASDAAPDLLGRIYSWGEIFRVHWQGAEYLDAESKRLALDESLDLLDRVDHLRTRQGADGRADVFAATVQIYHALTGYLLAGPDPSRPALEAAFAVSERMRGRLLLDVLDEDFAPLSLEDFESSLADDEAALIYQVAPDKDVFGKPAGGSWLMAVTREGTRLHRLASGPEIESAVAMVLGSVENVADFEERASTLRRTLLPSQLDLPLNIGRWIVVPDGALHHLPFNTLMPDQNLSIVPSATVWSLLTRSAPSSEAALIFADPETEELDLSDRNSPIDLSERGGSLVRLPFAEQEGRTLQKRLGSSSTLLTGNAATEVNLKHTDLEPFGILHFAAHAISDRNEPERSAIFLAPGSEQEDGFVQSADIRDLDLAGKLIVLSACQGADGRIRRGEGAASLAGAFLQAGARTVVAGLWRLPDDKAAHFFDLFYQHLLRGETVDGAVKASRNALRESGAQPKSWAGIVVQGDGNWSPIKSRRHWILWIGLAGLLCLAVLAWILYQR